MQIRVENNLLGSFTSLPRSSCPSSITSLFRTPSSHSSTLWFTCSVSYRNLSASLGLMKESWMPMQIATSYFGCKAASQMCHVVSNSKEAGKETRACFRRESGRQISSLSAWADLLGTNSDIWKTSFWNVFTSLPVCLWRWPTYWKRKFCFRGMKWLVLPFMASFIKKKKNQMKSSYI